MTTALIDNQRKIIHRLRDAHRRIVAMAKALDAYDANECDAEKKAIDALETELNRVATEFAK